MQAVLTDVDVERYAHEGYLTAPSVLSPGELAELREESDRVSPSAPASRSGTRNGFNGRPIIWLPKIGAAWSE